MKKAPEQFRLVRSAFLGSTEADGNNGYFIMPHPHIVGYYINCQISDGLGWEHVSVTISTKIPSRKVERCPTWAEMCYVKDQFFDEDEAVMQLHPPKKDHVSTHPYCLHLWRPTDTKIPLPFPEMVGKVGDNIQTF